jgi:adenylate kinase
MGIGLDRVINLFVPDEEVLLRLTLRRSCPSCGAIYHLSFRPPAREGVCDACAGKLEQRSDDREEVVRARLGVYREQTLPVAEIYRKRVILVEVDGTGSADDVAGRVARALRDVAA